MIIFFKNIKHKHILVCDIEYDQSQVIQFAGLLFKNVDYKNSLFQIEKSFNVFIKQDDVGKYTAMYTGIDKTILDNVGETEAEFLKLYDSFMQGVDLNDTLFVSHGSKNDRKILKALIPEGLPQHSFCTYRNAKRILDRNNELTLAHVANEAGYFLDNAHDAFADTWATVAVLSFLLKIDGEQGE
jgi:DNA polymerase III epsilon subunit-like protein